MSDGVQEIVRLVEEAVVVEGGGDDAGHTDAFDAADADGGAAGHEYDGLETDAGERKVVPRPMGYDVEQMNERYALVLMGSKAVVMDENPAAPIEERHAIRTIDAFRAWHANKFTQVAAGPDKVKGVTWAERWLRDRKRRQYSGIVFHPVPDDATPAPEGYFNLWRGFSVAPDAKAGTWHILRDHILNHVCQGNPAHHRWILGWMAHMVQRPRERIGTAIVLRGKMGTGKTVVGEHLGALIASHYFLVDDPRYVTGQFNAHMASCLLLQAEEAVWAGDKAAEGRLKGLITSRFQMVEAKGVDPIRLDNYVRLIMTSNEGWVVPAGKDERRFAVFDVSDAVAQKHAYFSEMAAEMRAGGYRAMLADLLAFDLGSVDLRRIPRTDALLEQKIRSLDSVDSWWHERLQAGTPTRRHREWAETVTRASIQEDYLDWSDKIGIRRRATETEVGAALRKLMPGLGSSRPWMDTDNGGRERSWCYVLPPLLDARAAFEAAVQQPVTWSTSEDDGRDGEAEEQEF